MKDLSVMFPKGRGCAGFGRGCGGDRNARKLGREREREGGAGAWEAIVSPRCFFKQ